MNDMSDIPQDLLTQSIAGRRLDNKCIILTGAAGSIGSYITRQLLREGARVMLTGRDQSKLDDFMGDLVQSYVNTAVSNLVDSAPAALNTLNELAAALGDDENFSTTVTNNIAAVNDRIDTEVFDAIATVDGNIPTNNNQLTNGAGYITAVPSTFDATSIGIGSKVTISESTDRADLLYINSHTSGWGGLQIGNTSNEFIFSLMGNGNAGGIYDDQNGDEIIFWDVNAGL